MESMKWTQPMKCAVVVKTSKFSGFTMKLLLDIDEIDSIEDELEGCWR
jgi:hypothetical protein